jgi:anti-anti-sigma regulatory factor
MAVATVGVLCHAGELLRRQSRSLVLRSPSRCAKRVLDLCGVTDLFEPSVAAGGRL